MFLGSLFENKTQRPVKVIYPGRFQPFHKGHAAVYQHLVKNYGSDNVFIVTSNKTDSDRSPFSFDEKRQMMVLTGINASKVVQSTQPYRAMEIVSTLSPDTVLLFAVSAKDMAEDPRFSFAPKKDGSPSYFQPFKDLASCQGLDKAAYMITVPTFEFTVLGKPATSASQIRAQFAAADENTQKKIVSDLFGKFDNSVYSIMRSKLGQNTVTESKASKASKVSKVFETRKITKSKELVENVKLLTQDMRKHGVVIDQDVNGYRKIASRLLTPEAYLHENLSILRRQFIYRLDSLDELSTMKLSVGTSVSIINAQLIGSYIEIWGNIQPKAITKIHHAPSGKIKQIEFNNDPDDVWPRAELATYHGEEVNHSAFFKSAQTAEQALSMLLLATADKLQIRNYIQESKSVIETVDDALHFATTAHSGQTRSGGDPYITHPVSVADSVKKYKRSQKLDALIQAALLHDTIEDTNTTYEDLETLFGGLVASLVKELTSDSEQIQKMGKANYLAHKMANMSSYALVIKLADRLDNIKDIATAKTPAWREKYKNETLHILDHIERNRKLSKTHRVFIDLIRKKLSELTSSPVTESKLIKDEFTVADFKIARFESWADYTRFLSSPKSSKRDTVWSWPSGVAKLLSPSKSGLLSESKITKNDRSLARQFSTRFKQLDRRDAVVIKKGNSISVLSSILDLDKKSVEIRGFVTPKKIAAINTNNDGSIDVIEFDDGSQFPERNELTNVMGVDITNTIFFDSENESTKAYTEMWMMAASMEGSGWEINNQLSESEITDTTQGKTMTKNLKEYANDAEYYESFEQWQKDVRRFGGDYEHGGDGCYYAHGIDGEGIGRWDERTGEGWIDASGDHEYMGSNDSLGEESVDEGRFVKGPGGVPLDRRGNVIPPKVDAPKAPRVPAGPRRDSNGLTKDDYSKVWRKIEDVVGNIFPDGDPIDWLAPWLKKSGIQDYHVGEVLDKACRMNGYKDMYEYYNSFKTADYGYNESVGESLGGVPWGSPQTPTSAHQKEIARKRMEYEKSLNQQQAKRGETYHSGNAVVTKPPVEEDCALNGEKCNYEVTYDIYGSNRDTPLYTKTRKIKASSEKEAEAIMRKLVGGSNYRVKSLEEEQVNELSVDSLKNYASAANRNRTKVTQQQQGKYDPRMVDKMDRRAEFAMRAYNKAGLDKLLAKTESLVANLKQHTANGDRVAVAECLTQLKPLFNKLNESQKQVVSESLKKI